MDKSRKLRVRKMLYTYIYTSYMWNSIRSEFLSVERDRKSARKKRKILFASSIADQDNVALPLLNQLGSFWYTISTLSHIFSLILNLFLILELDRYYLHKYSNVICLLPRFVFYEIFTPYAMAWVGFVFSLLNLIWRFWAINNKRRFKHEAIPFILRGADCNLLSLQESARSHYPNSLSVEQQIFFYKIEGNLKRVEYQLRPNRTRESHQKLNEMVEFVFVFDILILLILAIAFIPAGIYTSIFKQEVIYVGCKVVWLDFDFFLRLFLCVAISLLQLLDAYSDISFPLSLACLLTYDLMIYWREISTKMAKLLEIMPTIRIIDDSNSVNNKQQNHYLLNLTRRGLTGAMRDIANQQHLSKERLAIDTDVLQLQSMLVDFFEQLSMVDQFVSPLITVSVGVWLVCNAILYFFIQQGGNTYMLLIRILQIFAFVVFTMIYHWILVVKRSTEPAYQTICGLMALDPSLDKRKWISIVSYYTVPHKYAFTILDTRIFDRLTCFKIISYTFSIIFFIENLRAYVGHHA